MATTYGIYLVIIIILSYLLGRRFNLKVIVALSIIMGALGYLFTLFLLAISYIDASKGSYTSSEKWQLVLWTILFAMPVLLFGYLGNLFKKRN